MKVYTEVCIRLSAVRGPLALSALRKTKEETNGKYAVISSKVKTEYKSRQLHQWSDEDVPRANLYILLSSVFIWLKPTGQTETAGDAASQTIDVCSVLAA